MALNTIAALLILCCVAFPVISSGLVSPYLAMVFGRVPYVIGKDAMYLMVVIVAFIAVVLLIGAEIFGGQPVTVQGVTLCLLNAVIVALAANGMYDAAAKGKKTESYQHEE